MKELRPNKLPELTQLQYNFVKNYISNGFNCEQACIAAGYDKHYARTTGYYLPQHPVIKPLVEKAKDRARDTIINKLALSIEKRLLHLKHVMEDCIPLDQPVDDKRANIGIKAIQEINKMTGDYAPDKRLALTVDLTKDKLKEIKRMYEDY